MASSNLEARQGVKRVVFQQIVYGDFRKFIAKSNDAATGGGARDLRIRPHKEFVEIFRELFPKVVKVSRKRNDKNVLVYSLEGSFNWTAPGGQQSARASYEPPTSVRAGEGRIPTVYKYPPFNSVVAQWPESHWEKDKRKLRKEGALFLLLVQQADGSVWPSFVTEESLRSGRWADNVAGPILQSLGAKRRKGQVARGFIDLETIKVFSDAL